jgi:hypothetical protein
MQMGGSVPVPDVLTRSPCLCKWEAVFQFQTYLHAHRACANGRQCSISRRTYTLTVPVQMGGSVPGPDLLTRSPCLCKWEAVFQFQTYLHAHRACANGRQFSRSRRTYTLTVPVQMGGSVPGPDVLARSACLWTRVPMKFMNVNVHRWLPCRLLRRVVFWLCVNVSKKHIASIFISKVACTMHNQCRPTCFKVRTYRNDA